MTNARLQGIIFFFANIFASGLYVAGFVETLIQVGPFVDAPGFLVTYGLASVVCLVCLMVCLIGAG